MNATFKLQGRRYTVDLAAGVSLAIPIGDNGRHPRFFTDRTARFRPLTEASFSGRVSHGASCNADQIEFIPHCHGTHSEGRGHLSEAHEPVPREENLALWPAAVISLPVPDSDNEHWPTIDDRLVQWPDTAQALIVRTLPNDPAKLRRDYTRSPGYPLLSLATVQRMVDHGIRHWLTDTPSVDGANDPYLPRHRTFWGLTSASPPSPRKACTITEMIYVPEHLADGLVLLHLGISALISDAAPSAPTVYPLR